MTDWPIKTLGEVCEVLDSLRKPITKRDRTSGDYPYYGATGIVDYVGDYIFDERLVLVGEDGAKWDAGERTAFIAEGKYWVNNHAHVLRCKQGVLVDSWLANFLTMSDLNRYVSGLTVPKLNQGSLVSIEIPVPPLEEQKRIVELLDVATACVTELTACYEQARTRANNLFSSALRESMEKCDNTTEMTLSDICIVDWGNTDLTKKSYRSNGKYLAVSATGPDGRIGHAEHKAFTPVLSAIGARCGRMFLPEEDFTAIKNTITLTPIAEVASGKYIFFLFEHLSLPIRGAAQPFISKGDIEKFEVSVPLLEEQKRIVTRLDSMRAKTSEMVAVYDAKLTAAKNLRQSILEAAFAGDL